MYQVGKHPKRRRRKVFAWLIVLVVIIGVVGAGVAYAKDRLKPETKITQAHAVTQKVSYDVKTKHYDEGDFVIDMPGGWTPQPRPAGPYKSFTWQSPDRGGGGQVITIYEDTIPAHFAVNRVLIVRAEGDSVSQDGSVSDNCAGYTNGAPSQGNLGTPAKWQGVAFLCDTANQQRDVIGTSSTDGVSTVVLKSPGTGVVHKLLFSYTDYAINPDYTVFYDAIRSFHMQ
jgi:hypothetical protein